MRQSIVILALVLAIFVMAVSSDRVPPQLSIPPLSGLNSGIAEDVEQEPAIRLHLEIYGDGYFRLQNSAGSLIYTRNGRFHTDPLGMFVDPAGNSLSPPLSVPLDTINAAIAENGLLTVITASNPKQRVIVGAFSLAEFPRPEGLKLVGHRTYEATPASGAPVVHELGASNSSFLIQRGSELSASWVESAIDQVFAPRYVMPKLELPPFPEFTELPEPARPGLKSANAPPDIALPEAGTDKTVYGMGLVFGLSGQVNQSELSRQAITKLVESLTLTTNELHLSIDDICPLGAVSLVMVTATIPISAKNGSSVDVDVFSCDEATSVDGGTLVLTSLRGPDGETYTVASGKIVVCKDSNGFPLSLGRGVIALGGKLERTTPH